MKQKTIVLIILAVVCGLGASFMTSRLLADRQQQEETVKVLVAKKNLDSGMILKKPEDFLEEKEVPKESAPKNALTEFKEAKGRQLKIPRRMNDTITQDDLHDDKTLTLSGTLPPGHRAVGIRVSSEQIASGFAAVPHSRIDIACNIKACNDKDKECGTRLILQNVLVLASGQTTLRDDGGKAMMCDVVTVALTPEDALKLETAKAKGGLTMFLRPFGESSIVKTRLMTWDRTIQNKDGSDAKDDEDDANRSGGFGGSGSVANLDGLLTGQRPAETVTHPVPVNDKFKLRVSNGNRVVVTTFSRDADGLYESQSETGEPNNSTSSTVIRRAPRPGTAAPAPAKE